MQTQIRLENINKSYGKHKILDNLNISIYPEDFITIIGASGSGKSTLLNILGTLEDYDSGEVESFGYKDPIKDYKNSMILRREKIAYLFQNFALIENMTVKENLDIALKYSKYKNDKEKIRQILDMLGVIDKIDNKIYELSGGQQQRVAMARVLLKPYQILLADEPTGSLDKSNKDILIKILIEENKKGKTIVVVSHDMDFIKISKRAYKIIDKRLELIK
ncbi:ABC transporter ATP-binding protein [Anaerococcus sp. Marseille-P3625]|uniref:ABC transporter ATP-binding protein n=1 Tax=Anaerococcus sp. Marseille-P3625 TaxID=1977277 RepID=UPI000C075DAA|nr:ATP-binding cassette domain-containing protein [Anaerococcus sp. Marseille-P3625]